MANESFYMDLSAEDVREAMSGTFQATSEGADADQIETFLEENQLWIKDRLGGSLPDGNVVLRGILRDLAASKTMLKLGETDEDRRAARELRDDALLRFKYFEYRSGEETYDMPSGYTTQTYF